MVVRERGAVGTFYYGVSEQHIDDEDLACLEAVIAERLTHDEPFLATFASELLGVVDSYWIHTTAALRFRFERKADADVEGGRVAAMLRAASSPLGVHVRVA
ncbi:MULTISPECIES: hypothetical protein [unclassified Agrococcus]|uniref:DUF7882 family protein n=1 Tax=unclassified Agrococcus TaxID=2615065 RepID=UPI003609D1E1